MLNCSRDLWVAPHNVIVERFHQNEKFVRRNNLKGYAVAAIASYQGNTLK